VKLFTSGRDRMPYFSPLCKLGQTPLGALGAHDGWRWKTVGLSALNPSRVTVRNLKAGEIPRVLTNFIVYMRYKRL